MHFQQRLILTAIMLALILGMGQILNASAGSTLDHECIKQRVNDPQRAKIWQADDMEPLRLPVQDRERTTMKQLLVAIDAKNAGVASGEELSQFEKAIGATDSQIDEANKKYRIWEKIVENRINQLIAAGQGPITGLTCEGLCTLKTRIATMLLEMACKDKEVKAYRETYQKKCEETQCKKPREPLPPTPPSPTEDCRQIKDRLGQVESNNHDLQQRLDDQEKQLAALRKELATLADRIAELTKERDEAQQEVERIKKEKEGLATQLTITQREPSLLRQEVEGLRNQRNLLIALLIVIVLLAAGAMWLNVRKRRQTAQ